MSHTRTEQRNTLDKRLRIVLLLLCAVIMACVFLVATRVIATTQIHKPHVSTQTQWRRMIVDRNSRPLAVNLTSYDLIVNPSLIIQENTSDEAASLFTDFVDAFALHTLVATSQFSYVMQQYANKQYKRVAKNIDAITKEQIQKLLPLQQKAWYFQQMHTRFQPQGTLFANLIGLVDVNGDGQTGIERKYNAMLIAPMQEQDLQPVTLSIDSDMQMVAQTRLNRAARMTESNSGAVIVLDVKTGEVLVNSVYPAVDPNNRANLDVSHLDNLIFSKQFEPGSTIKPLVLSALLENYPLEHVIDISPGFIDLNDHRIEDEHIQDTLLLTVFDVIARSSNIGMSKMLKQKDIKKVLAALRRFGFDYTTEIRFPNEKSGYMRSLSAMQPIERANMSFGYGIEVTMAQLASAYQAIANGGVRIPLTLFKRDPNKQPQGTRIMSKKTAQDIMYTLEGVVHSHNGTGRKARVAGYSVAGKTGTTRIYNPAKKSYGETNRALFIGIVPSETPEFIIAVMLEQPQILKRSGGRIAAPVFSHISEELLRMRGIAPRPKQPPLIAGSQ